MSKRESKKKNRSRFPSGAAASAGPDESGVEIEEVIEGLDEATEVIPFNYDITSYGADYPVDALVSRINSKDIAVPTFRWDPSEGTDVVGFQREYVWPKPKADRFLESLLLGLPVPGIFLVKEQTGRLLVLDGHQRLFTLRAFYDGVINGQEYRLERVQDRFVGKRYRDLETEDRRRLDDSIIHATVVRQDDPDDDGSSGVYLVFERLNTGGVSLQPQEVRVALYHGEFVRVLTQLNDLPDWRALYGVRSRRLKDIELILRFFAFYFYRSSYRSPMKDFLNRYMAGNRALQGQSEEVLRDVFVKVCSVLREQVGTRAFRPVRAINAAVLDAVMVGVASRLDNGPIEGSVNDAYLRLIGLEEFRSATETGTSQEQNVRDRMQLAVNAFAEVK